MNKPVYLALSVLDLSKTVMYEFFYNYVKSKYGENATLCCMDKDSFIFHVKTDITENVEARFNTSNFELDRLFPKEKNKKVIKLMKDKLGGKIMKEFVGWRVKTYSYLKEKNNEDKKVKGTKRCVIKGRLLEDYQNCLEAPQTKKNTKLR